VFLSCLGAGARFQRFPGFGDQRSDEMSID
jgi:hypothetical protein